MSIRIVDSEEEFGALKSVWQELYDTSANHSPFQSWEWNYTWWKHFGAPGRLRLFLVEEGGSLIGIAPFQLIPRFRGWPLTHLAFIARKRSDYLDFLVRPGMEAVFFRQLLAYLSEKCANWRLVELRDLPGNSTNLPHLLREAMGTFPALSLEAGEMCVAVPLGATWTDYLASLGKNARRNAGRYRRHLEQDFVVRLAAPTAADDIQKCFEDFVTVYRSRWQDLQGATYFEQPDASAFEREICKLGSVAGWYRLYILYAGNIPVAGYLGYVRNNKYYAGLLAHRPDFHKYSAGTVLIGMTLEDCINNHWTELDMTRGAEPYKFQWNGVGKPNYQIKMFHTRAGLATATLMEWLYDSLEAIKTLHYVRARFLRWRFGTGTEKSSIPADSG
jgi:CelD/BcsL family acetyltransferase involved in cellulose biosynthesis